MKKCLILIAFLISLPVLAQAQSYRPRSLEFCVRQMGPELYNYGYKTSTGLLGAYQFNVNALFDAGVCTGQAPSLQSTNWALCNFRGLPAIDNHVGNINSLLLEDDAQDLYIRQIIAKKAPDYIELAKMPRFRKTANAESVLSALAYRKGKKAVEIYLKMNVKSQDMRGDNVEQLLAEMMTCGGKAGNIRESIGTRRNPERNYQLKVPGDFKWLSLDQATLEKQLNGFQEKPVQLVEYAALKKTDSIMYASVDLNGNGIPDYQYWFLDENYCGKTKCLRILVEDNGKAVYSLVDSKIRPAPYGLYVNGYYNEIYQ